LARKTHKKERKKQYRKQKCEGDDEQQELKKTRARDVTTASELQRETKNQGYKRLEKNASL
jgi:hypothetical protein